MNFSLEHAATLAGLAFASWVAAFLTGTWLQNLRSRRENAVAMCHEFFSADMNRHRSAFYNHFVNTNERNLDELIKTLPDTERQSPPMVLHFYERLVSLSETKQLDLPLAGALLGRHADWWMRNVIVPVANGTPPGSEWGPLLRRLRHLDRIAGYYKGKPSA